MSIKRKIKRIMKPQKTGNNKFKKVNMTITNKYMNY